MLTYALEVYTWRWVGDALVKCRHGVGKELVECGQVSEKYCSTVGELEDCEHVLEWKLSFSVDVLRERWHVLEKRWRAERVLYMCVKTVEMCYESDRDLEEHWWCCNAVDTFWEELGDVGGVWTPVEMMRSSGVEGIFARLAKTCRWCQRNGRGMLEK